MTFPPAYGLALLPFVIPTPPQAYPLLTLAGTAWLLLLVELHRARERRRGGREWNPSVLLPCPRPLSIALAMWLSG